MQEENNYAVFQELLNKSREEIPQEKFPSYCANIGNIMTLIWKLCEEYHVDLDYMLATIRYGAKELIDTKEFLEKKKIKIYE